MSAVHFVQDYNLGLLQIFADAVGWAVVLLLFSLAAVGWTRAMEEIAHRHGRLVLLGLCLAVSFLLAAFHLHARVVLF